LKQATQIGRFNRLFQPIFQELFPMRHPVLFLATLALVVPTFTNPTIAQAKPRTPRPAPAASTQPKPGATTPPAATTAACPYLNSSKDDNTANTNAVYDPATKTLKILVTRAVPDVFWPIAESMTRERVSKILDQCATINQIQVSFQSGQKLVVEREITAKK
jgi:hypothetical protein